MLTESVTASDPAGRHSIGRSSQLNSASEGLQRGEGF